jgi:CheY-like chemotaxis protein
MTNFKEARKRWIELFTKLTNDREWCKTQRFFHEDLFMCMNKEIRLMKNVGRTARCSVCNKSQFERRKPCIDGEKYHNFVRTGIVEYEEDTTTMIANEVILADNQAKNMAQSRNSTPRVMVVDDAEDILIVIRYGLEEKNFKVDTFNSAESALEAFERHAPDYYNVVLADIRLPKMNGFALYLYLKEKNPSMKILFMTAFEIPLEEFRDIVPGAEIDDIIKKPFIVDDLVMQIKHNLES